MNEFPNFNFKSNDESIEKSHSLPEEQELIDKDTIWEHPLNYNKYIDKEESDSAKYYEEEIKRLKK